MLLFQNARGKRVRGVLVQHRNRGLRDDRAGIDSFIDEVDRASRYFRTVFKSLVLRVETRKRREQGRVNIEDVQWKLADEISAQNPHIAG